MEVSILVRFKNIIDQLDKKIIREFEDYLNYILVML